MNAIQSQPKGGRVRVRVEEADTETPEVRIRIEDSGSGIAEQDRDRIFEPFFTTKDPGEGTGLGLTVSYGIVSDHGGRIEVESEQGRGSAFTVCLPAPAR
jgi:signal transduction histidine kinase